MTPEVEFFLRCVRPLENCGEESRARRRLKDGFIRKLRLTSTNCSDNADDVRATVGADLGQKSDSLLMLLFALEQDLNGVSTNDALGVCWLVAVSAEQQ